jgi:uncharacterized flavoprotein (TIGR03862 family)
MPFTVSVIGGGPAGLMAADVLSQHGLQVDVYDAMPSVGRKLLMAGKGGLNISHSEPFDQFLTCYGSRQNMLKPMLEAFGPEALREWVHNLGVDTFIGSSGRIFPAEMKAAPLLRAWLRRLRQSGVNFHMKHQWRGWCDGNIQELLFITPEGEQQIHSDAVVLALGGGSWPKLGSTASWVSVLREQGVSVAPLKPSNSGFEVNWSEHFRLGFAGKPLKSVVITYVDERNVTVVRKGEIIVTDSGLEGGVIYALSAQLRDRIEATGHAVIRVDLAPDKSLESIVESLNLPRGKLSMANHLRKRIGLEKVKAGLLREIASKADFENTVQLGALIKALPIKLVATRPIEEAISSAGGIDFEVLDEKLMLRAMPGVFCAGEMLDWEAPTGGYLLTACFASGRRAGEGVLDWLEISQD